MEKGLVSLIVVGIGILLIGGTLLFFHGLNRRILKQEFHYDTLFVQSPTSQNIVPKVIKTSSRKISPLQEKQEFHNADIEKALKKGMKIIKTGLLEQGFTEKMAAFYIGKWNTTLQLLLAVGKAEPPKEGKKLENLLKENQEKFQREKIEKGLSMLLYLAVNGDPNSF